MGTGAAKIKNKISPCEYTNFLKNVKYWSHTTNKNTLYTIKKSLNTLFKHWNYEKNATPKILINSIKNSHFENTPRMKRVYIGMKMLSLNMCTCRATDFTPTPSTLLLYGVLCNLTCQCRSTPLSKVYRRYFYSQTYQWISQHCLDMVVNHLFSEANCLNSLQSDLPAHTRDPSHCSFSDTYHTSKFHSRVCLLTLNWSIEHKYQYPVEWRRHNTNKATALASGDWSCEDNE